MSSFYAMFSFLSLCILPFFNEKMTHGNGTLLGCFLCFCTGTVLVNLYRDKIFERYGRILQEHNFLKSETLYSTHRDKKGKKEGRKCLPAMSNLWKSVGQQWFRMSWLLMPFSASKFTFLTYHQDFRSACSHFFFLNTHFHLQDIDN